MCCGYGPFAMEPKMSRIGETDEWVGGVGAIIDALKPAAARSWYLSARRSLSSSLCFVVLALRACPPLSSLVLSQHAGPGLRWYLVRLLPMRPNGW